MTVTVASFKTEFPEFNRAPEALVSRKIARAEGLISAAVWGDHHDDGVSLMAAHLLALSPFAAAMKLVAKDGSTIYSRLLAPQKLAKACGRGRVV